MGTELIELPNRKLVKFDKKQIEQDSLMDKLKVRVLDLDRKYKYTLRNISKKDTEIEAILQLKKQEQTFSIMPRMASKGEATAFMIASDWHVDETIKPETVSGLNRFNPQIAKNRAECFFRNGVSLLNITSRDVLIKNLVVPLLGDFILGQIHEELMEGNSMLPMEAILYAKELLASGMQFLLKNTDCNILVPCIVGNHGRITKKVHHATELGNSLEYFMYHTLAQQFYSEKRIKFIIPGGYHCYLNVYNYIIRLHHGHAIRFFGGVGGVHIPINKAIAQWNKAKVADFDILGHFHQLKLDTGNFVVNGSLIGYNAYAVSIKADYEKPRQAFFLIDKKRGKTICAPIILEET
jgi:hypothetical protein